MNKRILFIEHNLRNEKMGIMYLSASLKHRGHITDLVQTDKEDLSYKIRNFKPDFVAFSIATGEHSWALATAEKIHQEFKIPNIFGGPHCTFFPEFGYSSHIDFMVSGQGEIAIADIVEGKIKAGFVRGQASSLDEIPFADREIFYQYKEFLNNPMKNFITSRSCPNKCSYCFNHAYLTLTKIDSETEKWITRRSVKNVIEEIHQVRERYGLEKVLFIDDNFIQNRTWLSQFLNAYEELQPLIWYCSLRVEQFTKTLAEKLSKSGLSMINYALESADPMVQQCILNRGNIHNGDIIQAISFFNQFNIRSRMQNMIGLPLTNPLEDALNTLQFNLHHHITDSWCSIFQPYPRTALGQYCIDKKFISPHQISTCAESFFDESRLSIPNKKELFILQKLWYFIVEGNIPLDLVQILIRGDMSKEVAGQLQQLRFKCSKKHLYNIQDTDSNLNQEQSLTSTNILAIIQGIFKDIDIPRPFVELIAQMKFEPQEVNNLNRFLHGERIYDQPLYTINDLTGELADPNISIYIRGAKNPITDDIRKMTDLGYVKDIINVRNHLFIKNNEQR